jgi:hypothetical protein
MIDKNENYLSDFKESLLYDDVKTYASILAHTTSEASYKSNLLPGNTVIENNLFTPVYTSYELLHIKKL